MIIIDATTTQDEFKNNGIGVYTKNIVSRIVNIDKEIDYKILLFDCESTLDGLLDTNNVEIVRIGKKRPNNYLNEYWYNTQYKPAIKRFAGSDDSVYFCPYFWRGFPVGKMRTVVTVHDFVLPKFNIYSQQSQVHNLIRKFQYWRSMNNVQNADRVITDTEYTVSDFLSYYPAFESNKIKSIWLGVDLEEEDSGLDLKKYAVDIYERGYFIHMGGGLTKNKNCEGVIKGYKHFVDGLENDSGNYPYLVIAGKEFLKDTVEARNLKILVAELGLAESVLFTGFYNDEDRYALLKDTIAFLHLSLYEGFGLSVVEAMKAGVPVIAHNGSCYPEVVGDAGVLVDGLGHEEVGSALKTLWEDERFRAELISKGRERVMLFDWNLTAAKTLEVLKSVIP